jgi:hypothetical protein
MLLLSVVLQRALIGIFSLCIRLIILHKRQILIGVLLARGQSRARRSIVAGLALALRWRRSSGCGWLATFCNVFAGIDPVPVDIYRLSEVYSESAYIPEHRGSRDLQLVVVW